jgi:hypothetical protein
VKFDEQSSSCSHLGQDIRDGPTPFALHDPGVERNDNFTAIWSGVFFRPSLAFATASHWPNEVQHSPSCYVIRGDAEVMRPQAVTETLHCFRVVEASHSVQYLKRSPGVGIRRAYRQGLVVHQDELGVDQSAEHCVDPEPV